jgi:hypothetical protein
MPTARGPAGSSSPVRQVRLPPAAARRDNSDVRALPVFAVGLFALLTTACEKKPERTSPSADAGPGGKLQAVDRALGAGMGGAVDQGKGAVVAQQCALACGAKPGIDPGTCTAACVKTCAAEKDLAAIDACTSRVAAESPAQ